MDTDLEFHWVVDTDLEFHWVVDTDLEFHWVVDTDLEFHWVDGHWFGIPLGLDFPSLTVIRAAQTIREKDRDRASYKLFVMANERRWTLEEFRSACWCRSLF